MSRSLEELYQMMGRLGLESAVGLQGRLLIYAEVQEGVVSTDLFFESFEEELQFRIAPRELRHVVYEFWERWKEQPGETEWFSMSYKMKAGSMSISLKYPDQLDPNESAIERREVEVKAYFGDKAIDYAKPGI